MDDGCEQPDGEVGVTEHGQEQQANDGAALPKIVGYRVDSCPTCRASRPASRDTNRDVFLRLLLQIRRRLLWRSRSPGDSSSVCHAAARITRTFLAFGHG